MAEIQHQGVMAMVKIDGDKVKHLREHQGLTQLYVATVVQVTTDTISRWENKRYPTIKKENAIRLAEALEVQLDAILIPEEEQVVLPADTAPSSVETAPKGPSQPRVPKVLLCVILAALVLAGGFTVYFLNRPPSISLEARRFLPKQCTTGQPFPVAIEVSVLNAREPISIIVKEDLPDGFTLKGASPPLPGALPKNRSLKWLQKVEGKATFTYIVTIATPAAQEIKGQVSFGSNGGESHPVTGPDSVQPSTYHWADANGDNVISDQEILTVYDQYGDLEQLGLDVDLIEEIWLGSGYTYNLQTRTYEILP